MILAKPDCYPQKMRVLCLDRSTATASPIIDENSEKFEVTLSPAAVVGFVCVVVGSLAFAVLMFKRQKDLENKMLDLQK